MFVERIASPGLAHWSYYLEDAGEALVIDPRLDAGVYVDLARSRGARIATVLETHRNEDYLVGSVELAARTGAVLFHADGQLDYTYGTAAADGQRFGVGGFELEALLTPGHTAGHHSYLLRASDVPWMLFSGDLLFAGDAGRVDLDTSSSPADNARALFRSLHERVLPLGDHVIVRPAHGRGSACGSSIADREHTTLGLERALNPLLSMAEDEFVGEMVRRSQAIGRPPYFTLMEDGNRAGHRFDERVALPRLTAERAEELISAGALVLDTRATECYVAAHLPGSLGIPSAMIGAWAGWLVDAGVRIVLVSEDPDGDRTALARIGLGDLAGFLGGGIDAWTTSGRTIATTHVLDTPGVCHRLDEGAILRVLDVRGRGEVAELAIEGALNIPLHELPDRLGELTEEDPIVIFCGSGRRSAIAAGVLERAGRRVEVVLGGTTGWSSGRCPLREVASG